MASMCMAQNHNNNYSINHQHNHHHNHHHHQLNANSQHNQLQNNNSYSHQHHQHIQHQNQNHNQIQHQNQNSYQYLHGVNLPQTTPNHIQLTQGTQGPAGHQTAAINHYVQKLPQLAPAAPRVLCDSNVINIQSNAAPSSATNMMTTMTKKRYTYANMPYGEQLPSVARRNARERNRVKQVNNGFANLRQHIPQTVINNLSNGGRGASKKLSKVDTLRIAVEYIRGLQQLLDNANDHETTSTSATTNAKQATTAISATHYNSTTPIMNTMMSLQSDDSSDDGLILNGAALHSPMTTITSAYQLSHSPVSSYSDSDISIGGANTFIQPLKLENSDSDDFKFEGFEHFSHLAVDEQPDDEELLDYISSWQDE